MEIKIGDVVKLNSGGHEMTVIGKDAEGSVLCVWFSMTKEDDGPHTHIFPPMALKKIT